MANVKRKSWREQILISSLFVLFGLVATYPLIFKFRSYIYGKGGDSLWAVWAFWWTRYAYFNALPFNLCPFINSPSGINFSQHPFSVGLVFISKWFSVLTGEIFDILKPETPGILSYLGAKYVIFHPEKYAKSEEVAIIGEIPYVKNQPGLRLSKSLIRGQDLFSITPPVKPKTHLREQ